MSYDKFPLYHEVYGTGYPVLLIAGLGSDSSSWLGVSGELSKKFRVIIFDNRGCGRSDVPPAGYTIKDMADDAVRLLDALEIKKAHIVGHSMGGYIAQEIAVRSPERVDKLILESTSYVSSDRNNELFAGFLEELKKGSDYEEWIRTWASWIFSPKTLKNEEFISAFVRSAVEYPLRQSADSFRAQVQAIASFDGKDNARHIKAGTLVLEGGDDRLITPSEAEALAKSITKSSFSLVKDAGHSLHIEKPEEFLQIVLDFLKKRE